MSAVTLVEIADLVAGRMGVAVAAMRGFRKGRATDADIRWAQAARAVVVILAHRHTQASLTQMAHFFGLAPSGARVRFGEMIDCQKGWLAGNPEIAAAVDDVEQQIDALHERRISVRDRKSVQA